MVGAWFAAEPGQFGYAAAALGTALVLCGGLASFTALGRWIDGYRQLAAREEAAALVEVKDRRPDPRELPPAAVSAPNPMRISGEHTA